LARLNGSIHKRAYGFAQPEGGGPDIFVHSSAVERAGMDSVQDGQKISYEEQRDANRGNPWQKI
jgi:CspA family cold shock protein